ncbi:hypothetical protein J6590_052752 [Homalodisca vitripennis]|nr:hypothetical protein J6590_052752 [Homalodisca vitripennis]
MFKDDKFSLVTGISVARGGDNSRWGEGTLLELMFKLLLSDNVILVYGYLMVRPVDSDHKNQSMIGK